MKAKIRSTSLSKSTIGYSLNDARGQIPADSTGIVFLRIPLEWTDQPDSHAMVIDAIESTISGSRRIAAVILMWERWDRLDDRRWVSSPRFRSIANPRLDLPWTGESGLFRSESMNPLASDWLDFGKLLCDKDSIRQTLEFEAQLRLPGIKNVQAAFQLTSAGAGYFGDLDKLHAADNDDVITLIEFETVDLKLLNVPFPIAQTIGECPSFDVALESGPIKSPRSHQQQSVCDSPGLPQICLSCRHPRIPAAANRRLTISRLAHFTGDDDSIPEADIDKLATACVTKGYNPPTNDRFCPH